MTKEQILKKIYSVKLCMMAHPDALEGGEFEDRINDLIVIEEALSMHDVSFSLPTNEEVNRQAEKELDDGGYDPLDDDYQGYYNGFQDCAKWIRNKLNES